MLFMIMYYINEYILHIDCSYEELILRLDHFLIFLCKPKVLLVLVV